MFPPMFDLLENKTKLNSRADPSVNELLYELKDILGTKCGVTSKRVSSEVVTFMFHCLHTPGFQCTATTLRRVRKIARHRCVSCRNYDGEPPALVPFLEVSERFWNTSGYVYLIEAMSNADPGNWEAVLEEAQISSLYGCVFNQPEALAVLMQLWGAARDNSLHTLIEPCGDHIWNLIVAAEKWVSEPTLPATPSFPMPMPFVTRETAPEELAGNDLVVVGKTQDFKIRGRDVFARSFIPSGRILGRWVAPVLEDVEAVYPGNTRGEYTITAADPFTKGKVVMDQKDTRYSNWTRFINVAASGEFPNCRFECVHDATVVVVTVRDIQEGEVLLVSYSPNREDFPVPNCIPLKRTAWKRTRKVGLAPHEFRNEHSLILLCQLYALVSNTVQWSTVAELLHDDPSENTQRVADRYRQRWKRLCRKNNASSMDRSTLLCLLDYYTVTSPKSAQIGRLQLELKKRNTTHTDRKKKKKKKTHPTPKEQQTHPKPKEKQPRGGAMKCPRSEMLMPPSSPSRAPAWNEDVGVQSETEGEDEPPSPPSAEFQLPIPTPKPHSLECLTFSQEPMTDDRPLAVNPATGNPLTPRSSLHEFGLDATIGLDDLSEAQLGQDVFLKGTTGLSPELASLDMKSPADDDPLSTDFLVPSSTTPSMTTQPDTAASSFDIVFAADFSQTAPLGPVSFGTPCLDAHGLMTPRPNPTFSSTIPEGPVALDPPTSKPTVPSDGALASPPRSLSTPPQSPPRSPSTSSHSPPRSPSPESPAPSHFPSPKRKYCKDLGQGDFDMNDDGDDDDFDGADDADEDESEQSADVHTASTKRIPTTPSIKRTLVTPSVNSTKRSKHTNKKPIWTTDLLVNDLVGALDKRVLPHITAPVMVIEWVQHKFRLMYKLQRELQPRVASELKLWAASRDLKEYVDEHMKVVYDHIPLCKDTAIPLKAITHALFNIVCTFDSECF